MVISPLVFVFWSLILILPLPASTPSSQLNTSVGISMLFNLLIPATMPIVVAAYAVVGEREQGTLEPMLTTPVLNQEILIGKALAALVPAVTISYTIFAIVLAVVGVFAEPNVALAVFQVPLILALALFAPLTAGWSILVGIATSVRSRDVRTAQQIAALASLPLIAIISLMGFGVIPKTTPVALGIAAALLLIDSLGWRVVSAMFKRERLVTGS
jgi:ABC-2 type transport system permease protein